MFYPVLDVKQFAFIVNMNTKSKKIFKGDDDVHVHNKESTFQFRFFGISWRNNEDGATQYIIMS